MAQKRTTVSAKQMELKTKGGLSGSSDNKAALVLDLAGMDAAAVAQTDLLTFADASASNFPKKITFSDSSHKESKEILEDLILAAHNDAKLKLKKKTSEEISKVTGGINLPPGFKLPF